MKSKYTHLKINPIGLRHVDIFRRKVFDRILAMEIELYLIQLIGLKVVADSGYL